MILNKLKRFLNIFKPNSLKGSAWKKGSKSATSASEEKGAEVSAEWKF
jgi:hypothetical protein